MLNVEKSMVLGYKDKKVPFEILRKTENPHGIAILLPGLGYTVQGPVLHFSTGLFLNKGFEVLHVNYQYHTDSYDDFTYEDLEQAVPIDVQTVLDEVLREKNYESIYLIGKSFGTLAMPLVLQRSELLFAKAIWLTPLLNDEKVFNTMKNGQNPGQCIMGTHDQFYDKQKIDELKQVDSMNVQILDNINHSLEYDTQILESIDALKEILKIIDLF